MTAHCPSCGVVLEPAPARKGKRRSTPQHARYFKIIEVSYYHWPESCEFQPDNVEHLRKWLQCQAGPDWRYSVDVPVLFAADEPSVTMLTAQIVTAVLRSAQDDQDYAFVRPHPDGGMLRVFRSKSIKYEKMPHMEFCALNNAVEEVLRSVGIDPNTLLEEHAKAA